MDAPGETVPRAGNKAKQLGQTQEKVEDLWYEEDHQRFTEVPKNSNNGESHSGKIAKRITNKNRRGAPRI